MCRPICSNPGVSNNKGNQAEILLESKARKISFADNIIFDESFWNFTQTTAVWLPCGSVIAVLCEKNLSSTKKEDTDKREKSARFQFESQTRATALGCKLG